MVMKTAAGRFDAKPMRRGMMVYVPPLWAHRTVNTGDEPCGFLAVWPGDAGHDYGTIEHSGFAKLLVVRENKAVFVDNPDYGSS